MIRKYAEIFWWKNVSSFCTCSAKASHIFPAKNIRILYIESAKTVNEMTLNELIKLTTLWTTGPWCFTSLSTLFKSYQDDGGVKMKGSVQGSAIHYKYPKYPKCKFWYILSTAFTTNIWTNSSGPTICSGLSAGMVNTLWLCCGSVEPANLLFKIHSSSQKPSTPQPLYNTVVGVHRINRVS